MELVLNLQFNIDNLSIVFSILSFVVFLTAGIFSFEYMKHEGHHLRYTIFYVLAFFVFQALCFADNLITYYFFFEMLTLTTFPLVLHNGSKEAIMAGLKYLFYSLCGAYMVLFGLYYSSPATNFSFGGYMTNHLASSSANTGSGNLYLICITLMIFGFGVKAGMFPMHAWLPTAHPVAPAPASAVLSAIIVKAGVLGIIRTVFYVYGSDFIKGTFVQTLWMIITLVTVFMGSMLAFREDGLKKRLAYSTVSQVSYILFGLSTFTTEGFDGAILQVVAHGFVKCGLFLCAGAIIYKTGKTKVSELRGIGKQMPVTMVCFTILSLSLIGIPPTGGFVAKWFLAIGSLESGMGIMTWLGPVILLVSALLTAGYLLPVSMRGFFPGDDFDTEKCENFEPNLLMTLPIIVLTVLAVLVGVFPGVIG
ncbi:MAG: proton-conducting transporter membrane subunit [Lachnospiraceae bacterium]|nr:proton-conducting transporter membrane subunit [Lachnospiraceae bacterium]